MRASADNAYCSVGARCFGVLAALLGGHGGYGIRRAAADGELTPAPNDADEVGTYKLRTYATN
jgi:hypothetical protein